MRILKTTELPENKIQQDVQQHVQQDVQQDVQHHVQIHVHQDVRQVQRGELELFYINIIQKKGL